MLEDEFVEARFNVFSDDGLTMINGRNGRRSNVRRPKMSRNDGRR